MREIKLTDEEYMSMNFILGKCTGMAWKDKDKNLAEEVIRLANTLNRGNPEFLPYETSKGVYLHDEV